MAGRLSTLPKVRPIVRSVSIVSLILTKTCTSSVITIRTPSAEQVLVLPPTTNSTSSTMGIVIYFMELLLALFRLLSCLHIHEMQNEDPEAP
jgi:hypothetical protein